MGIKQLYDDNLRKLPNEYGDVSVIIYSDARFISKSAPELRTLWWCEYFPNWLSWMPPYLKLCDVTQPKLNLQNQIIKGFQEYFATDF